MYLDTGDVIIIILTIIIFVLCIALIGLVRALDELKVKLAHSKVRYNKLRNKLRKYYKGKKEV